MTDWGDEARAGIDRWMEVQRAWWEAILRIHEVPGSRSPTAMEEAHRRTLDAWTDAQREAWRSWLAIAHGYQPGDGPAGTPAAGAAMVDALCEAAERLVQAQADWARAWNAQSSAEQDPPSGATD